MAMRPHPQFVVHRTYDDFEPKFDEKEEPTSYALHVYLTGFTREQLKVTYDESLKKIKARGERPLGNYRWSRFEKEFSIPDNCIGSQIKGKFERNVLIITMQKKTVAAQNAPQQPPTPPYPAMPENHKQAIPPTANIQKPKEDKPIEPPSPKKAVAKPKPQKGKQDFSSDGDLSEKESDKKTVEPASPKKVNAEPKPEKGKQDSPQKPPPAADKDHPEVKSQTRPQKVKDQSPLNPFVKKAHESVTQKIHEEEDSGKKSKEQGSAESENQDPSKKLEKSDGYRRIGKRLRDDEESKRSLVNAGVAAMVIVAMGTYIAYTIT